MVGKKDAWDKIFKHYKLLDEVRKNSFVDISSTELKSVSGEEARILAKMDCREDLPAIMIDNGLSILAIENGLYRIASIDPFIEIQEDITTEIIDIAPPKDIICIDPFAINSESAALDISAVSGIHDEVFGAPSKLVIRGRRFATFEFNLGKINYDVKGVQIEVDGGYETKDTLNLVEAKNSYRSNIGIRQLMYPQLYWSKKVEGKKEVKSFIFYLHNDIFRYIPYIFDGKKGYADHSQEKAFRFKITESKFTLDNIETSPCLVNMQCPFPQADRFDRIDNMLSLALTRGRLGKGELETLFNIHARQIDYYTNVLKWLGLFKGDDILSLTSKGNKIASMPFHKRMEEMAKIVFSDPIFNRRLNGHSIEDKHYEKYRVFSNVTIGRRMKTVDAWIAYFTRVLEV
ncbi:MAG: hypothetical protein HAW61_05640 [Candidatus Portiera sp.]|nr:hypothetical protein [Portiera sp.]